MRRNWDMIRAVLLDAEEAPIAQAPAGFLSPSEAVEIAADNHVTMLVEAGYLGETDTPIVESDQGNIALTWAGYELLEAIRDDSVWATCQSAIAMNGGGLPTDLLLEVARHAIRNKSPVVRREADGSLSAILEPGTIRYA
jgi:hypothetical protein